MPITTTTLDLTPFGFTPTESIVYRALLELGPSTGYAVARAVRLARANTYSALEGLVARRAAMRASGRPARFRALGPDALLAQIAALQGAQLERLSTALRDVPRTVDPIVRFIDGSRAMANAVQQLVARAEHRVDGVIEAELWRLTIPAWRRAATRATLNVRVAGDVSVAAGLELGTAPPDHPTMLLVDGVYAIAASGSGSAVVTGLWSAHPLLTLLVRAAVGTTP